MRKSLKKFSCLKPASSLCILPVQAEYNENASLTNEFDHGGLIYPPKPVEELVVTRKHIYCALQQNRTGSMLEA